MRPRGLFAMEVVVVGVAASVVVVDCWCGGRGSCCGGDGRDDDGGGASCKGGGLKSKNPAGECVP